MNKLFLLKITTIVAVVTCSVSAFASQHQNLVVSLKLGQVDTYTSRKQIVNTELEKCVKFGVDTFPFDKYFLVESACFAEYLDNNKSVKAARDLRVDAPKKFRQHLFPTHISSTFIDKIKSYQEGGSLLAHHLYDDENGNILTIHYFLEETKKTDSSTDDKNCIQQNEFIDLGICTFLLPLPKN